MRMTELDELYDDISDEVPDRTDAWGRMPEDPNYMIYETDPVRLENSYILNQNI